MYHVKVLFFSPRKDQQKASERFDSNVCPYQYALYLIIKYTPGHHGKPTSNFSGIVKQILLDVG